ncbi:MAG: Chromosome partition protein Smc [Chlamydiae bacterium]|nr:Chromosome partition protein Smc [Chlamydiota bacterium]
MAIPIALIQTAAVALESKGKIPKGASGNLKGRKVAHWTFWPNIVVSVVAAVAAAAFFALGLYFAGPALAEGLYIAGGACALLCVTSAVAAFYAKRFGFLKNMEEYSRVLKAVVGSLWNENSRLEKTSKGIGKVPGRLGKVVKEGEEKLGEKIKDIEAVSGKLGAIQKRLSTLGESAIEGMGEEGDRLSKLLERASSRSSRLEGDMQELKKQVSGLNEQNETFAGGIASMGAQTNKFKASIEQLSEQIQDLDDLVGIMEVINKGLREGVSKLDKETDQLEKTANDLDDGLSRIDELVSDATQVIELQGQLFQAVKKSNYYKAGCKKFRSDCDELKELVPFEKLRAWQDSKKRPAEQ